MKFLSGIIFIFLFPYISSGQCPTINTAMINACAIAPSVSEGINEFVYFSTTASATAGSYTLSYGTVNPPLGGASSNTLAGSNARTKNGPGTLTSANGCVITYVTSPATVIPANSGVIFIPSNFDNNYDLTGICTTGSLYAILVDINAAPSNTWGAGGTFANNSGANLRYLQISNGAANCSSNIVSYNGNGWPGNSDGNSVWWDGTPNYQNNGCNTIKPPKPTITPDPISAVCPGTPGVMSFNTTGVPDQYSIDWNNAANAAGFIDVSAVPLPAFPITLTPPANVPAGTYTGILTVINSLTPDTSIPQNISVTVNPAPVITVQPPTTPQKVCQNATVSQLSVTANAGGGTITGYQWYLYTTGSATALPFATTNTFQPSSANVGTLHFYCIVTNSNGCSTTSDTATLIVSPNIATPTAAATQQPTCAVPAGTITVTAPVATDILYSNSGAGGPFQVSGTFANLTPGTSYNIVAKDTATGCVSPVRTVAINALPAGPVVAASVTTAPTCSVPTGTITVSSPTGADYEYSVGGTYQSTTVFAGLAGGITYNVTVRQISTGCISPVVAIPMTATAGAPARPDITVVHPDCITNTGSITVTAPLNVNYEYSIGGAYQTARLFSNLTPGTNYSVTVRDISTGCISAPHDTAMNAIPVLAPPGIPTPLLFYCENATAPALTATGSNLQWYSSLTGGTATTTAPTPVTTTAGEFKFYVSQKNGVCESTRDSITVTINAIPALPGTAGNTTAYCQNQAATVLTATGTNLQWYNGATGGAALPGAPTPSTTAAAITTYYVTQTINGCESGRSPVAITVNALPAAPNISGNRTTYCKDDAGDPIVPNGPQYLWYTAASGGTGTVTPPVAPVATTGTFNFYVSETTNGCKGPRATLTITVNDIPAAPSVNTPVVYCQGSAATSLTAAAGSNLLWYVTPPPGAGSPTAPTPSTNAAGNTDYYVTQTVNGCTSPASTITVNITAQPAAPVTAPLIYCQNDNAPALTATGTGLLWYGAATGGTGSSVAPAPVTSNPGTITYYVSQTVNGCESGRSPLAVTVNAKPAAPNVSANRTTYCKNDAASSIVPDGSQYLWYTAASGGTGTTTPPVAPVATAGVFNFYVSEIANGCESPRATLTITVNDIPAAPTVTSPLGYCQGSAATSLIAAGVNLLWYLAPPPGAGSSTAPTPSTTAIGNTDYFVTQTVNGCISPASTISVNISAQPAPPVTTPLIYCQNDNAPALTATGTGLLWYSTAAGGTSSSIAPTPSTSDAGTKTYYVSQTVNGCESGRAVLIVTVNATPAPPSITTPVIQYCQNATPNALTVTGTNVLWYTAPSGGSGSPVAPAVSTAATGSTFHYVTQTVNGCESGRDLLTVTIVAVPTPPVPVTPVDYCQNQVAAPVSANGIGLRWYSTLTTPTQLPSAPTPSTTTVGSVKYYVSQFINTCESKRDSVIVTIKPPSPQPVVVSPLEYCQNIAAPALSATGTNLLWYSAATGGTGSSTAPIPPTATPATTFFYVTQNANGCESTPRTAITVTVKVTSTAVTGFRYSADTFCLNAVTAPSPFYDLGFTTGGTFTSTPGLSINAATGDINLASSNAGTYSITYTYNTTGCVNGNSSSATITLNPAIPSDARFSYNSPVCKDAAPVLPQTVAGFTTGGVFTSVPGSLSINSSTGEVNIGNSPPGTYTVLYNVNAQGCRQARNGSSGIIIIDTTSPVTKFNYSSTDICLIAGAVNPTISTAPGFTAGGTFTVTPAGLNVNSSTGDVNIGLSVAGTYLIKYSVPSLLCRYAGADSVVFKLKNYGAPVTGFSYVGPVCKGDDNAIPVMDPNFTEGGVFSSSTGLAVDATSGAIDLRQSVAGDYTIRYDVAQGVCNPADFGLATIKVLAQPEAPDVTSATVCGEGTVTLDAAALGTISWYTEPALLNQVNAGSSFTTFINTTTPFYVTNTVGSCESEPAVATAFASPVPVKPYIGGDTSICANEKLVLNAGAYNSYLWQDGSTGRTFNVVNSGAYKVIVSTGVGCSDSASVNITVLDNCTDIMFPNAFSPNGDIHNPTFGAWGNFFPISNYTLRIYNRYGQEVFATADPAKKWDGTYKGKLVETGAYVYVATYLYKKTSKVKKGTVMVIR